MTESLHRHYRRFRERMTEEIGLQMFSENILTAECSTVGQQRPEKLDRLCLKTGVSDNKR